MRKTIALRTCGIALLLAAATAALAQSASSTTARPTYVSTATTSYSIAGTVVNAVTGEPVSRAAISVLSEADSHIVESVETDGEGRFALQGLPAAKFPLTASKRGFLTSSYDEHDGGFNTAIVTGPDQDTSEIVFRLTPGAMLRGVVTADGGDPVEGASVMLFRKPQGHNPGARVVEAGSARSDDTGAYEFDDLAAGEYMVAVTAEPWYALHRSADSSRQQQGSDPGATLDVAYPVTFFDSTTDEASAESIALTGGSREEANINLRAVPALHLTVQAPTQEDGARRNSTELRQTVFGAKVNFATFGPPLGKQPSTGDIEFNGVAPGHYELTEGNPPRVMEFDATSSQEIDPSLGTPTVSISGSARTASGAAFPGKLTLILLPLDVGHPADRISTESNQGNFRFLSVQPGRWELEALSQDPGGGDKVTAIVATTVNGVTHAGDLLTVRDRPLTVQLSLFDSDTRVEGFARKAGKGQAGALIMLVPKAPAAFRALTRIDQSDSDGSFSLHDVAPGEYTVVAIENAWEMDRSHLAALQRYLSQGVAITVPENSGKLVKLPVGVPVESR